jgi:hypothetical protein
MEFVEFGKNVLSICDLTQFDVFPESKTMLLKKFFRAITPHYPADSPKELLQ